VAEGEGWGDNTKKIYLHLQLTLLMIGTIPPLTLYALMAWQGTTSPFSFTYIQTEIADTDTQMETNPGKSLHHMAFQSGVSKSSTHTETNIQHSSHIELMSQNN